MNLLKPIRRLFRLNSSPAPFAPRAYWTARHQIHGNSIQAVGHRRLSDQQNFEQYQVKRERITCCLRRRQPDCAERSLLDAGCGSGVLSELFVQLGYDVTGVDFCAEAIVAARKRVPKARFAVSELSRLKLDTDFDSVAAVDVLLHVIDEQEWRRTVAALARHVAPDGLLLLLDCLQAPNAKPSPHCHFRSLEDYEPILNKSNLHLFQHDRFELPHEKSWKDLLIFARKSG